MRVVIAVLLSTFAASVFSDEIEDDLFEGVPEVVHSMIDQYRTSANEAREDYERKLRVAKAKLQHGLEQAQRDAVEDNDSARFSSIRLYSKRLAEADEFQLPVVGWRTVFRGSTGEFFNSETSGDHEGTFAIPLIGDRPITHLRLTNMSTNESVVVRCDITIGDLGKEIDLDDKWVWNGTAKKYDNKENSDSLWQLGLANRNWRHGYKEKATIAGPKYGFGGFGFGRANHVYNHGGTRYMWNDEMIDEPFTLEVSVTAKRRIDPEDGKLLNARLS